MQVVRCPECGATNPDAAAWCSLCLTKLAPRGDAAPPEGAAPREPASGPVPRGPIRSPPPAAGTGPGPRPPASPAGVVRRGEEITWRCPGCDRENAIEQDRCPVCGASLYQLFGPAEPPLPDVRPPRDPRVAAALSVLPGAGHFYLRRPADGILRLVLAAWWLAAAVLIDPTLGFFTWLRLLYAAAFLALAAVSAVDAHREAKAAGTPPLLTRNVVLWATGGLMAVSILAVMLATMAARR